LGHNNTVTSIATVLKRDSYEYDCKFNFKGVSQGILNYNDTTIESKFLLN